MNRRAFLRFLGLAPVVGPVTVKAAVAMRSVIAPPWPDQVYADIVILHIMNATRLAGKLSKHRTAFRVVKAP